MNTVGLVSIALGALFIFSRGYCLIAPAPTLRWFRNLVSTNFGVRKMGVIVLAIGITMIWAGSSEDSGLADVLNFVGFAFVGISTLLLLLFPGAYRSLVDSMIPEDTSGVLNFVRFKGLTGVIAGVLLICFGALAL